MSKKNALFILGLFITVGVFLALYFSFVKDIGMALIVCGGILMFSFLFRQPDMIKISRVEEIDKHIEKLHKIDYFMLLSALGIGLVGVVDKVFL